MKHFLTIADDGGEISEHESEDAARAYCAKRIEADNESVVRVYRFVTRARAKITTDFDGGCEGAVVA